jgi:hypothetical protein
LNEWHEFEQRVTDELESLDEELSAIAPLRAKLRQTDPDPIELRAAATTLHAFYNGVERLLMHVSRRFDDSIPTGISWHRELLNHAAEATSDRSAVLSANRCFSGSSRFTQHSGPKSRDFLIITGRAKVIITSNGNTMVDPENWTT